MQDRLIKRELLATTSELNSFELRHGGLSVVPSAEGGVERSAQTISDHLFVH